MTEIVITVHRPPATDHRPPITGHRSPATGHRAQTVIFPIVVDCRISVERCSIAPYTQSAGRSNGPTINGGDEYESIAKEFLALRRDGRLGGRGTGQY